MTPAERRRAATVLRGRMEEMHMTTADLARKAGVDPTTVRRILRAETDPNTGTRQRLANALGWPLGAVAEVVKGSVDLSDVPTAQLLDELRRRCDCA